MSHEFIGGIENYHRILYTHWKGKHQVTEFPTFDGESTRIPVGQRHQWVKQDFSLLGWKPHNVVYGGTFTKKNFHKVFDNHDVVLLSCPQLPKKWINHPKAIIVQHMNKDWYTIGGKPFHWSLGQAFGSTFFGAGTWKNSFKNANRTMFYAPEAKAFTKGKSFYAPLPYKNMKDIKLDSKKREGFVWMARLDQHEKNVKLAVELANKNKDVMIYGAGPAQPIIDKKLKNKSQFGGKVERKDIDKVLGSARAFMLTSSFEGFGFTVTEALSNGTPAIIFDTFDIARFFAKSKAVFVIKPGDKKAYQEAIDKLRDMPDKEYKKLQKNAIEFAKKELTQEAFWKSWDKALLK